MKNVVARCCDGVGEQEVEMFGPRACWSVWGRGGKEARRERGREERKEWVVKMRVDENGQGAKSAYGGVGVGVRRVCCRGRHLDFGEGEYYVVGGGDLRRQYVGDDDVPDACGDWLCFVRDCDRVEWERSRFDSRRRWD